MYMYMYTYLVFVPGLVPGTELLKPLEFPEWLKSVVIHNNSLSHVPELMLVRWFLEHPYLVSREWLLLGLNGWTFNTHLPPPNTSQERGGWRLSSCHCCDQSCLWNETLMRTLEWKGLGAAAGWRKPQRVFPEGVQRSSAPNRPQPCPMRLFHLAVPGLYPSN